MPIEINTTATGNKAVCEASGGLRTTLRPNDVGVFGSYYAANLGSLQVGLAQGVNIFTFRWPSASTCVIRKIRAQAIITTAFTGVQDMAVSISTFSAYTVAETAGTIVLPQKKRTSMAASLVDVIGNIRSVNPAITGGTKTTNATPLAYTFQTIAAAALTKIEVFFDAQDPSRFPLVLAQNEGFGVQCGSALGAVGQVRYVVEVEWDEMASY